IVVAVISSFFGVKSLFTGAMIPALDNKKNFLIVISIVVIVLLLMVEFGYIIMVKRTSDRRIKTFMEIKRGDN
ncbi:MAG: ABC transporter permease, partial [Clostridiaceae bacterium]|nr:ABC transporter permease [Clostridiaceae bacterium]